MTENNERRFSVGILAEGNKISTGCENLYLDYFRLRAKVYVDETGIFTNECILDDGTERDADDLRSVHFGVVEDHNDSPWIIAALRLIIKNDRHNELLPIEKCYKNVFADAPLNINNLELSRYICHHENKYIQFALTWPLFSVAVSYALKHNISITYAVIEPILERTLKARGFPVKRLAEPAFLPHYNSVNIPVNINNISVAQLFDSRHPNIINKLNSSDSKFIRFKIFNKMDISYEND